MSIRLTRRSRSACWWVGALATALVAVGACSDATDEADGGSTRDRGAARTDGGVVPPTLPAGLVTFRAAGATTELSFTRSGAQYLVVPYSTASAQAEALDFSVEVSAAGADGGVRNTSARSVSAGDPRVASQAYGLRVRDRPR
ncbi:MAG: hypothetical protein IPL40_01295 [Proteobacteria bacterium]|nr:hypothetical protein [Pseudomonadota bacterium]